MINKEDVLQELRRLDILPHNTILLAYRGSIAHGMYVPPEEENSTDDIDLMGIVLPSDPNYYFGLRKWGSNGNGTKEIFKNEWDCVYYDLKKIIYLLLKSNPNVLSLLWLPDEYYLIKTAGAELLRENKKAFASKRAYHTFIGYAYGQLKKMENNACKGYMGDKRKKLVKKYGYDTKNAAHLIRLLRMAIEFLQTGEMLVNRSDIDAMELLSIKSGEWSLAEVKKEAENLFEEAKIARDKSPLPDDPDQHLAEALLVDLTRKTVFGE